MKKICFILLFLGCVKLQAQSFKEAVKWYNEALDLSEQGKPNEALQLAIKAYNVPDNQPIQLRLELAIANLYLQVQKPDSSLIWGKQALKKAEKILEQDSPDLADYHNIVGNAYFELSQENEAVIHYKKSMTIYENTSVMYLKKGDFNKCILLQFYILAIQKKVDPAEYLSFYETYDNLQFLYMKAENFTESLKYLELMKPFVEKKQVDSYKSASFYLYYGIALAHLYRNEEAYLYTKNALQIFEKDFREERDKVAECYQNLGLLELNMGNANKCIEWQKKSIAIRDSLYGTNNTLTPDNYIILGDAYMDKGIIVSAISCHIKSLGFYLKIYGVSHPKAIQSILKIASLSRDKSTEQGLSLLNNFAQKLSKSSTEYAEVCIEIGTILLLNNFVDEAKAYFEKADEIYKSNNQVSQNLINAYAELNLRQKRYDEAYRDFRYLTINHKTTTINKIKYLNNLALACIGLEKWDEAIENTHKSLMLMDKNVSSNLYTVPNLSSQIVNKTEFIRSLRIKIEAFARKGKARQSKIDLQAAIEWTIFLQNFHQKYIETKIIADEKYTLRTSLYREAYILAIRSSYELFLLENDEKHLEACFLLNEKTRGSLLSQSIRDYKALHSSNVPQGLISEVDKCREVQGKLLKKLREMKNSEEDNMNIADNLLAIQTKRDSLFKRIEEQYPKFAALKNQANRSFFEIQKQIQPNEAIISYLISDTDFLTMVVTQNKIIVKSQALHANLQTWVEKFRTGIERNSYKLIADHSWNIYQYVFANIAVFLQEQKISKLIIIPEGSLSFVPFEALITSPANGDENFNNLPYLIKKYQISYAITANFYFDTRQKPSIEPTKEYFALAPVFSSKSEESIARSNAPMKARDFMADGSFITPLPGTLEEVNQVAELFKSSGKEYKTLLNTEANEKQVKRSDLKNYKYLHFATHGFVNEIYPDSSGLILAQQEPSEDNILYSTEVYSLSLNADLLVLSACQTGLGGITDAGEGLVGLGRGFLYAGVRNMIVSLWSVSDAATAKLMVDFFNFHNKQADDFQTSMHKAKLELLKDPAHSSPFFWAPFILVGK